MRTGAAWAIVWVALSLMACGGGPIVLKGRIMDASGTPLSRVQVHTDPATDSVISNERGHFVIAQKITEVAPPQATKSNKRKVVLGTISPGTYRVRVTKDKYHEQWITVELTGGEYQLGEVVLAPKTGPFPVEPPNAAPAELNHDACGLADIPCGKAK